MSFPRRVRSASFAGVRAVNMKEKDVYEVNIRFPVRGKGGSGI